MQQNIQNGNDFTNAYQKHTYNQGSGEMSRLRAHVQVRSAFTPSHDGRAQSFGRHFTVSSLLETFRQPVEAQDSHDFSF